MSRTYLLLQKKLHELKSELTHLPESISSPDPIAYNFWRRMVFLRNLLTAEIAVHPLFKPNHLVQIKVQLDKLEVAFCHRYAHNNSFDGVQSVDDLACSCRLNDGGETDEVKDEEGLGVYEATEKFNEAVETTVPEKMFVRCDDGWKEKDGGGSSGAWRRKEFRVLAIWMMLGAILMVNFSKLF